MLSSKIVKGATLRVYKGAPHGMCTTLKDAEEAELDLQRYDYDMGDHVYPQRVQEHIDGATRSRVRSTPPFFVNGIVHDVSFGLGQLQQAIETELGPVRYARRGP